ncbi:glycosyltransferase [Maribellus sediminis]|uniref:glycosyltransferase n=1 Tax=Maribellus sediminis TaxID=2696285 RepID=UPI00143087AD|nr:glycosyltransferase [Maribellus sediminis]
MFADKYLIKNQNVALVQDEPDEHMGLIVVIPCLNEPEIVKTLESLVRCDRPGSTVEIIVLINHSETAAENITQQNQQTKAELDVWMRSKTSDELRFYAVGPVVLRKKWAGAGLARKKGMDEAVRRFNLLNKTDGIIVSLDADTLVAKNYLVELERHFKKHPKQVGATLAFEHPKDQLDNKHREGIELYEKYLYYYKNSLDFAGYPHAMFTIGSAFAVTADAYVRRGGMNRRQAGEDFYFLQNLVQLGTVGEITGTKVYPSARLSDRVPFGTGPILSKWMSGEEDLLKTYSFQSFIDLKKFFDIKCSLYKTDFEKYNSILKELPNGISEFLHETDFWLELEDLNRNCSTSVAFKNRFFQKFNAFKILKYLNFMQENHYPAVNLNTQLQLLENASC